MLNAGCGGGIIGNNQNQASTLTDITISNLDVYSQGAASYSGPPRIGGVVGSSVYNITVESLKMTNVNVISDGVTGLVLGQVYNNKKLTVQKFVNKNCTVAVTQLKGNYLLGAQNDPNGKTQITLTDKNTDGAAGMLLGANKDGAGILSADEKILGYNIAVENLTLGAYCGEKKTLTYTYEYKNELSGKRTYSGKFMQDKTEIENFARVIGLYDENKEWSSYGDLSMADNKQYCTGYLGLLVGAEKDTNKNELIRIVGISIKGGNYLSRHYAKDSDMQAEYLKLRNRS